MNNQYWASPVPSADDFGDTITDTFIDGKTIYGPWAAMTPASWTAHGVTDKLGLGIGQRYERQPVDNRWLKVEG